MTEKKRKQVNGVHFVKKDECCELYAEYCYPCNEVKPVKRKDAALAGKKKAR